MRPSVRRRDPSRASLAPMAIVIATVTVAGGQAAAAMTLNHAASQHLRLRTVADVQPQGPLEPFAATPSVVGIDPPTSTTIAAATRHEHHERPPAATAIPASALPRSISASAAVIPKPVLAAYVNAARIVNAAEASCHLQWQTLAGIGYVESDNARSGGSASAHWDGISSPPILGPVLNGTHGYVAVADTDGGALDGDSHWDRAIGPMQFLPSTWEEYEADGDHDGIANPQDIDDATLAAADYLCATGNALDTVKPRIRAIYAYNHSYAYVRAVLAVAAHYEGINPAKLGIGHLPKDRHKKASRRKARPERHSAAIPPIGTPTGGAPPTSPTASPAPVPSTSPSQTPPTDPSTSSAPSASPVPVASSPGGRPQRPRS